MSKRQRGSLVDSSAQLSIIRHMNHWKVVVERCTHYLGYHSIKQALSHEEDAIEWESNQKSSLRVLSLSWIFDLVRLFVHVDTGYKRVLVISMIKKPFIKVVSSVRNLLRTGFEANLLREINKILMALLDLVYLVK